jgi:succinoglycan biosynthesis protein ExoA
MTEELGPLVVIPCLNEAGHLPALLDQLLKEPHPDGTLIVVADGGSKDATTQIAGDFAARHPEVRFLADSGRIAVAVNLAVRRFGRGRRWLVRMDAHADYPPCYVAGLIATASRVGADEVVVPMVTRAHPGQCFQAACASAQNSRLGTGGSLHRHVGRGQFVDHGHHALFGLAAFAATGGYDESFTHNEDAELDCRLAKRGTHAWLEPGLAITYYPRAGIRSLFRQYFAYGRGRARTIRRHRMPPHLRQLAPLAVAPAVALAFSALPLAPLAPSFALALASPAILWAALALAIGARLGIRAASWCSALSGIAAMTMHLAWSLGFWRQLLAGGASVAEPQPLTVETALNAARQL